MVKVLADFKVLLADGNRHMRAMTKDALRALDITDVAIAFDVKSAMDTLRFNRFDLLITSQHGESVDGLELARQVRASDKDHVRNVPTIMMVASKNDDVREAARQAGATEILVKPFSAKALYASIAAIAPHADIVNAYAMTEWSGGPRPRSRF